VLIYELNHIYCVWWLSIHYYYITQ
jgi:hypothetical protein